MDHVVLVVDDEEGILESYRQFLTPADGADSALERLRRLRGGDASAANAAATVAVSRVLPAGWSLALARSGEDALALGRALAEKGGQICVGLFDVKMPSGIDGIETMLQLLQVFPDMRCGVVSAYHDRSVDQINALLSPVHKDIWDFLAKPFTEPEIRQKTRMLCRAWLSEQAERHARAALAAANAQLEERVEARTRELDRARSQLALGERLVALGTLAAGIGHEINNPLAYVMANLEFLSRELSQGVPSEERLVEVRRALFECREGSTRIERIVGGLNALARPQEERRVVLDLPRVLERALAMTHNEIRHRARLVKRYDPVPRVEADDARLIQVFINLLVNAAQAIPEGQSEHHEIEVTTGTEADGRARVQVRDTGSGIPADKISRIFDPFFTLKPVGVGTGLGLSISHGIVSALGGTIEVESQEGRGTTFRVLLPATVSATETRTPATVPVAMAGRRGRVLVVDDEPTIGDVIRRLLEDEHDVSVAQSGQEALSLFRLGDRYDVILCDLMMPDLSGMEVHAALLDLAPEQAGRMAFMTGGAFTTKAQEFLAQVPNPHFEKPFQHRVIRSVLHQLLGGPPPS